MPNAGPFSIERLEVSRFGNLPLRGQCRVDLAGLLTRRDQADTLTNVSYVKAIELNEKGDPRP